MSSLVLTIQLLRYLILTHTLIAMLILRLTTRYKPADQAVYSLEFPYEKNTTECVRHRLLRSSCPGPRPEISRTGACTSGDHANRETVTTGVGDFWYSTATSKKDSMPRLSRMVFMKIIYDICTYDYICIWVKTL